MLDRQLRHKLYRHDCPSAGALRDYYWNDLPAAERGRVQEHLKTCSHCSSELEDLAQFAAQGPEIAGGLGKAVKQIGKEIQLIVAQLLAPVDSPLPILRGESKKVLLFEAGPVAVTISLKQDEAGMCTLYGQILSQPTILEGYVRTRRNDGTIPAIQAPIDENGGFSIPCLCAGAYQLIVNLPEQRIVLPEVILE